MKICHHDLKQKYFYKSKKKKKNHKALTIKDIQ